MAECPIAVVLAAAASLLATTTAGSPLRSGVYEGLTLGVTADGRVTGRFFEERGTEPHFSCAFFFAGTIGRDGSVKGDTWADAESHAATLSASRDGVRFAAPSSSGYPGCGMTIGDLVERPTELSRTRVGDWDEVLEITGARVRLRPRAAEAPGRAYVVAGDVVGLLQRRPGWLQVEYVSAAARASRGWIRADEAAAPKPPRRR